MFAVLVAIVVVPAALVIAIEYLAREGRSVIADATAAAAREAAAAPRDQWRAIAARHEVRLWVADPATRETLFDSDHQPELSDMGMRSSMGASYESIAKFDDGRAPPAQREHAILAVEHGSSAGCATFAEDKLLVCEAAVRNADRNIVLAQRAAPRAASRLADVREGLLLLGGAILVAGGLLAGWLVRKLTSPLAALDRQVAARARGEQREIAIANAPREIAEVAAAVDDLSVQLETRRKRDAEAAADLAHELKSPLARIKLAVEANDLAPAARAALDDAARRAVSSIDRVLVELLEIARVEAGQLDEPRTDVDLVALAETVVADRPPPTAISVELTACPPAGQDAKTGRTGHLAPRADIAPLAVARALGHLIDNAYAHAKARVTIEVAATGISVRDDGPGVPHELRPKLFQRFASRRAGGTGLGLAFVRAVAEAHGGSAEYTGDAFVIRLPAIHTRSTNV